MSLDIKKSNELPFGMPEFTLERFVAEKRGFGQYLQKRGVADTDKKTPLGKYLRTMRFYPRLEEISQKLNSPVHLKGLICLVMQESGGDPVSRNMQNGLGCDGGAGLLHTQPDTAVRVGLSLYSNKAGSFKKPLIVSISTIKGIKNITLTHYKDCDYHALVNKGYTHEQAYRIHGAGIIQLKEDAKLNYHILSKLDDRFNDQKNIEFTVSYFHKAYSSIIQWADYYSVILSDSDIQMYIINAFNKGYNWTTNVGQPKRNPRFLDGGNHMKNLQQNLLIYEKYNSILEKSLTQGLSHEQIYDMMKSGSTISKSQSVSHIKLIGERKEVSANIKQHTIDFAKSIIDRVKSNHMNIYCAIRVVTSRNSSLVRFDVRPQYDSSLCYSFNLQSQGSYWIIDDGLGTQLQIHKNISVGAGSMVYMLCNILNNTCAHRPDDVEDGVCTYANGIILFNQNWSASDQVVANNAVLKSIFDAFPHKVDDVCSKVVTMINNIYKSPGKSQ